MAVLVILHTSRSKLPGGTREISVRPGELLLEDVLEESRENAN